MISPGFGSRDWSEVKEAETKLDQEGFVCRVCGRRSRVRSGVLTGYGAAVRRVILCIVSLSVESAEQVILQVPQREPLWPLRSSAASDSCRWTTPGPSHCTPRCSSPTGRQTGHVRRQAVMVECRPVCLCAGLREALCGCWTLQD